MRTSVEPRGPVILALVTLLACGPAFGPPGPGWPGCDGRCDAKPPAYPAVRSDGGDGDVTMYATGPSAGGACNYGTTSVRSYAAINVNVLPADGAGQWQHGRICGQCAEVTAFTSRGPVSVVVRIMDKCPDGYCGIDLGGAAPGAIMLDGYGRYAGTWRFVSCAGHPEVFDGAPRLHVLTGSNGWWSRVQVRDPPEPVAAIAWEDAGGTARGVFPYAADPENAFEVPVAEVLRSTMAALLVTVTFADGSRATVRLTPAQLAAEGAAYPLR